MNTSPLLIRGGRIVDPADDHDRVGDLLIEAGKVVARGPVLESPPHAQVLDASGLIVCPGFIDLHTHLRFPGFPAKETVRSGTEAAAAGGFTTVCAMANTNPVVDTRETLRHVLDTVAGEAIVRVEQLAAVTVGLSGRQLTDISALRAAGAVAFSDDGKPVVSPDIMRAALVLADDAGTFVSAHEEDPDVVGDGVANAGERARRLGLVEWPCSGEARMVTRDVLLAEETGGHLHVAHVSCADTVPILKAAKARGVRVTAEVTPHHLRLTDRLLEGDPTLELPPAHPRTKVNPPLRSETDVEALIAALADGTIDAIATDHAPHTAEDKSAPYTDAAFGISGIETALPLALDLVRVNHISLPLLIRRLTADPGRIIGREVSIHPGASADICIFDPDEEWVLTPESLRSRGKNTPLLNARLKGRVRYTIVSGQIAHQGPSSTGR